MSASILVHPKTLLALAEASGTTMAWMGDVATGQFYLLHLTFPAVHVSPGTSPGPYFSHISFCTKAAPSHTPGYYLHTASQPFHKLNSVRQRRCGSVLASSWLRCSSLVLLSTLLIRPGRWAFVTIRERYTGRLYLQ
jgi:hypothetical protein